ncbi:hypothetical protein HFP57_07635 [Parasphingopyxis algicola]|nr:hypothetical protein HFP57_07635 [Parasphingopyxis algicola]
MAESPRPAPQISDAAIRREIVANSRAAYSGSCPCPDSRMRNGRRCGGNSAYSRPGRASPLCYPDDVAQYQIDAYRQRHSR